MGQLTDVQLKHWIKAGRPVAKADGGGLTFTLSAKGTAAWVLRYRHGGKQRELTLGRYPDIGLVAARRLAVEARAKVQQGLDVGREKQRAKQAAARAQSFRTLAEDYLEKAVLAASTIQGRRQQLRDYVYPRIGHLAASDVTAADIVDVVERAAEKSLHVARLVLVAVREVFAHGVAKHVVAGDPCAHVAAKAVIGPRPVSRTRIKLTEDELRVVLPALHRIGRENELMVKILLATAARIGELVHAKWADVDLVRRTWTIPPENIKGLKVKAARGEDVRSFVIPLADPVVGWFRDLEVLARGSSFVLPIRSRKKAVGDAPMDPVTLNAALDRLCADLAGRCRRFTPHDLRSTARSHLGALGVNVLVAERCLNHSLGGLVAVYDVHDYLDERRAALTLWARTLAAHEAASSIALRAMAPPQADDAATATAT